MAGNLRRERTRRIFRMTMDGAVLWLLAVKLLFAPTEAMAEQPVRRSRPYVSTIAAKKSSPSGIRRRATRRGWEIRGDRIAVIATSSPDDAEWTYRQLQSAWSDMAEFSGNWGNLEYRPKIASGQLIVFVGEESLPERPPASESAPVNVANSVVSVHLSSVNPPLRQQRDALRRAASRAFLRVSDLDLMLPRWVQDGLVDYLALYRATNDQADQKTDGPGRASDQTPLTTGRPYDWAGDGGTQQSEAALWVHYLIEGEDGQHAPEFFAALRQTLDDVQQQPRFDRRYRRRLWRQPSHTVPHETTPLDALIKTEDFRRQYTAWLQNPDLDQPRFTPDDNISREVDRRQREMVLILKLARRFSDNQRDDVAPRVVTFSTDTPDSDSQPIASTTSPWEVNQLFVKLTRQNRSSWATLDFDGRLLFSSNHVRIDELFAVRKGRYRTELRDGITVLICDWKNQTKLEAWLEEDPLYPRRPLARVKQLPAGVN